MAIKGMLFAADTRGTGSAFHAQGLLTKFVSGAYRQTTVPGHHDPCTFGTRSQSMWPPKHRGESQSALSGS
jgi:hypothetical protein